MAPGDDGGGGGGGGGKGRKRKYHPHGNGKPTKRKGSYPLRPGVQGFFITCDGGRERQAIREALSLLDSFYEELVNGEKSIVTENTAPPKRVNKVTKFEDSDASSDEDDDHTHEGHVDGQKNGEEEKELKQPEDRQEGSNGLNVPDTDDAKIAGSVVPGIGETTVEKSAGEDPVVANVEDSPNKKRRIDDRPDKKGDDCNVLHEKPIDDLIDDELKELGDKDKRHFVTVDSGCNGVVFIQMHKRVGDPTPVDIVKRIMCSAKSTRRHMSRSILRLLPAELSCYASEEEIAKAIKPIIEQYFPEDSACPSKFAVLYEARSNTGIDRTKIIDVVAKSVPLPHKVDLSNPDKTIVVQIVKTICLVGVVERYKELAKYNLRELTSNKS